MATADGVAGECSLGAVPELSTALKLLAPEPFAKMIAFLRSRVGQRVRTNNDVERMNRVLRLYEKIRYKWRSASTKVRFVWLLVDRRWGVPARAWAQQHGGGVGKVARGEPSSNPAANEPSEGSQREVA